MLTNSLQEKKISGPFLPKKRKRQYSKRLSGRKRCRRRLDRLRSQHILLNNSLKRISNLKTPIYLDAGIREKLNNESSLRLTVERIIRFMLLPYDNLPSPLDNFTPIKSILMDQILSLPITEKDVFIRTCVESYMSDSHLVRATQLHSQLSHFHKNQAPSLSSYNAWENIFNKISSDLDSWKSCFTPWTLQSIRSLNPQEWKLLNHENQFSEKASFLRPFVYSNHILWVDAEMLTTLPVFKATKVSVREVVQACCSSKVLKCATRSSLALNNVAHKVVQLLQSADWSELRSKYDLNSPASFKNSLYEFFYPFYSRRYRKNCLLLKHFEKLLALHASKNSSRFKPDLFNTQHWYIGRPWDGVDHLKVLQQSMKTRTIYVDNLPFRCTSDVLRFFLNQHGFSMTHICVPRFAVSREIKAFAYLEFPEGTDLSVVIELFHNKPQSILEVEQNEISKKSLVPRNSRPMIACTRAEWDAAKNLRRKLDILGLPQHKCQQDTSFQPETSAWVTIENIQPPVSELAMMHFIQHSVVPLRLYYTAHTTKAFVMLKSVSDAHHLCFDVKVSKRLLGSSYRTTARICTNPLNDADLDCN